MSNLLKSAKVGIVALNWKFEMAKSEDFLSRIAAYGFKGIQISVEQANSDKFLDQMKKNNLATAEQYLDIACDENGPLPTADAHSQEIVDGMKVIVCKLKQNPLGYTSVAYPTDELRIPEWFKELPFDDAAMAETIIDNKLDNLIGVLDWDIKSTEEKNTFNKLFEF